MSDHIKKLMQDNPAMYHALMAQIACEKSLYSFTELMWEFVEPANKFIGNWHLQAIAEHLEAVTNGEITRLLINIPPGTMKSLMTNVFWPAWEWIHAPHMRYISTSYSAGLTERDNIRFRQVITSDLYRAMWGDKFGFSKDSFNITKIGNDKTGWKIATSTEGMGTGERGNRVICISYDGLVLTERGMMPIGEIVENIIDVRVASMNIEDESFSWKKITAWKKNPGSKMVEVGFHGGSVKFTPDHKIWTHNRGWVRADSLLATDVLPCTPALDLVDGILINAKHVGKVNLPVSGKNYIPNLIFGKGGICNFSFIAALSNAIRSISPRSPAAYGVHQRFRNSVPDGNVGTGTLLLRNSNSDAVVNFPIGFSVAGNMRSVNFAVSNILLPRSIVKIISEIIGRHSVPMANIVIRGTRANERERDHLVHMQMMCSSIFSSVKSRIALPIAGSFHNFLRDRKRHWFRSRTLANNDAPLGSDSPVIADAVDSFKSGYCSPLFVRDAGHESSTYCLTVETNHTFCVGGSQCIVVSNCDDPHNVKDGESDAVRKSTLQYFNEVLPTRVTDPISSAMVVIMQRVHEEDVSGNIISRDLGYTHLMLPMEFEPDRKCYTFLPKSPDTIFFEDPRTEPGELLFPARMPDWVVERDKKAIGPYAAAGQFQQSPIPRGGGIIKREYWKLWPEEGGDDFGIANPKLEFPAMDFIIASVDTAYSAKTEADYNALAILGVWRKLNVPKIMLMHCWKKRLDFRGETLPKLLGETDAEYRSRRKKAWGMLEWTSYECQRFGVDTLLIEAKATGKTLAQEIRKVYSNSKWGVQEINPRGDKVARVYAVQHIFAEGMVYAPERQWAEDAITEMQHFPKGAHDDLTDAITQGISWLRSSGWALRREEVRAEDSARGKYRSKPPALYDV